MNAVRLDPDQPAPLLDGGDRARRRPRREKLIGLRLTDAQYEKADEFADRLGVTRSEAIRRMIDAYAPTRATPGRGA